MKAMLDALIKSYKCPHCQQAAREDHTEIIGAAGNTINVNVSCTQCKKSSMIKAEVAQIQLNDISPSDIQNIGQKQGYRRSSKVINDEEIVSLSKNLGDTELSASDLFKN